MSDLSEMSLKGIKTLFKSDLYFFIGQAVYGAGHMLSAL